MRLVGTPAREPNTPGFFGYLLGSVIAFGVAALLLLAAGISDGGTAAAALLYLPIAVVVVGIFGAPVAVVGFGLVQLFCSRVRAQPVHVTVAAVVGVALAWAYGTLTDVAAAGPNLGWVVLAVGVGAGTGRAAVIPLVRSRRRLAAVGQLRGTARW